MEKVEELLGSHPANVLSRLQEGGAGVPEPVICPSTGSTPKIGRVGVSNEKSENVRMMNDEIVRKMRDAEKVLMKVERKKIGEKEKKKEKKLEKQRVEAERNRKSNRMRDWLANRNLREASGGNASGENASYENARNGNASGVCLGDQDVVQNVGEIVASFALERLEEQQPGKVNHDWHTLEEGTLVSRDKEVLADEERKKDKGRR